MKKLIIALLVFFMLVSCKDNKVEFLANNCKANPAFIQTMGFNPARSYLSTSEVRTMGLVLIESKDPKYPTSGELKKAQHPSWKMAGWLAPILLDEKGNIFTAPAPFINTLNNPIERNNTIFKVDYSTGEMKEYLKLPLADSLNSENPYGIISMAYLCETATLYVSSVAGSRRYQEKGNIYAINTNTGKVIDEITNTDAMGLGVSYISGKRKLYFGSGRNSDVISVTLNASGKFSGNPQFEFSLQGLGPRGDDKVRKIRTDQFGNLIVHGMEFNYNLIAPREKQETIYSFIYQASEEKWVQGQ